MLHHIIELVLPTIISACELIGIFVVTVSAGHAFFEYLKGMVIHKKTNFKLELANGLATGLEFKMAAEIYSKEIDGDVVFFCGSWLMYPPLIEELDDRSNTKKFAKRFELIEVRDNAVGDHPDAWRLFDCDYNGDINSLDTSTGLRAAFVRMLKKKNVSGDGVGIFFYE